MTRLINWLIKKFNLNVSDGYHTFKELYEFRMLYNAAFFKHLFFSHFSVHKSLRHYDGELCFGGGWFIVVAELPTGVISNHYESKYWDLFHVPSFHKSITPFDGHTPQDVVERLTDYCKGSEEVALGSIEKNPMWNSWQTGMGEPINCRRNTGDRFDIANRLSQRQMINTPLGTLPKITSLKPVAKPYINKLGETVDMYKFKTHSDLEDSILHIPCTPSEVSPLPKIETQTFDDGMTVSWIPNPHYKGEQTVNPKESAGVVLIDFDKPGEYIVGIDPCKETRSSFFPRIHPVTSPDFKIEDENTTL